MWRWDENGAEAAAYTSIGINAMSAPLPLEQVTIRLDRPFIFAINSDNGDTAFHRHRQRPYRMTQPRPNCGFLLFSAFPVKRAGPFRKVPPLYCCVC